METIDVTEANVNELRETWGAVDQRAEIAVGDVLWTFRARNGGMGYGLWSKLNDRAAVACGGDSAWGDARGGNNVASLWIEPDDGAPLTPTGAEVCVHSGCVREATTWDVDGDACCVEHSAKSYEWVVVDDLEHGPWLDEAGAARVVETLTEQGWHVTIRSSRGGEIQGTHTRNDDGTLQHRPSVMDFPERETFDEALRAAVEATR